MPLSMARLIERKCPLVNDASVRQPLPDSHGFDVHQALASASVAGNLTAFTKPWNLGLVHVGGNASPTV
jgi:hypothetical protein